MLFATAGLSVPEGAGQVQVTVTRSGEITQPAAIDYATSDGTANDRLDNTTAVGRLQFGAGETEGRAAALRSVAESVSVYNKQFNPAFVLMQYIGYLRRNPDDAPDTDFTGYDFWLTKLNSFSLPGEDVRDPATAQRRVQRAEMVKAFIISDEYRQRLGR